MDYVLHPRSEIKSRIKKLQSSMDDGMDGALLFQAVDMCYFSGTAQDGLVYIPRDGEATVMMRRSLVRAREESPLEVRPLENMRNLKEELGIKPGATIGLVIETQCNYFAPLAFPQTVEAGIRVARLGASSVRYEVGLFAGGEPLTAGAGHFIHVYVDRTTRRPVPVPDSLRDVLEALQVND